MSRDRLAKAGRQRIDRPALEPLSGYDRLAAQARAVVCERDALERRAGEGLADSRRPIGDEAAIRGPQRRDLDPNGAVRLDPTAVGAEPRPGGAAEREHRRAGPDGLLARWPRKAQGAVLTEAREAGPQPQFHAEFPELAE